ncbi:MAG: PAS domain S-box protein, partial [candidate division NC10 bacterium]|nr:PAS domain S-box protein [candidate division NC10 bacterium]
MEERQIRILLIEDNPGDTRLLQEALAEVGETSIDLECVSELSTGLTRLAQGWIDLVLLDLGLPDSQGLETLGRTHGAAPEVPIVVLTGLGDDSVAVHALRRGAQDYLVKGQVESGVLRRTIRYAIERHRMQVALRESEARKGAILEAALDCIVTMDHEGRIVEFNPAAERTFGYTRAEVLGKEMVEVLIPPALREPHRLGLKHYLATGEGSVLGKRLEMPAMRADGSEFPVEVAVTRIPLPGPPMFSGAIRDLTERKRAEKTRHALYLASLQIQGPLALRERLDRILQTAQTLLELERVNILLADREGQWLQAMASLGTEGPIGAIRVPIGPEGGGIAQAYLNRQIVAWDGKGRVPEPLRLQPPYDRIEALRSQVFANVPLIVQGRAIGVLVLGADRKGSRRPLDAATLELLQLFAAQAALAIEHGRLYEAQRMAAIQLEATVEARTRELQDANAKLEAAVRLAEEASRHKSEFLANTSHEFRTPLNSILGFSELLKDRRFGPLTEKEACYVNNIWTSGKHLLHVINDILDLSKVEAGRIELKSEPFHLTDALQATLNTIRPQAEAKGVQLQLNGDRCPPTLVADPTRFNQILYN